MLITNSKDELGLYFDDDKPDLESLAHYGILGMKWGVRRSKRARGTRAKRSKARNDGAEDRAKRINRAIKVLATISDASSLVKAATPEIKSYKKLGETTVEALGEISVNMLIRRSGSDRQISSAVKNIISDIRM